MTIYNLFTCRVLAFSGLSIGTLIRKPARNLPKENFEVGVIIVLPRLPEVDILHRALLLLFQFFDVPPILAFVCIFWTFIKLMCKIMINHGVNQTWVIFFTF